MEFEFTVVILLVSDQESTGPRAPFVAPAAGEAWGPRTCARCYIVHEVRFLFYRQ
jgi:hypothetical protein